MKIVILDDNIEGDIKDFSTRLQQEIPSAKNSVFHFKYASEFLDQPQHRQNDTDIVLLDVEGMPDPQDVIPDIHRKWLRLPVVILSKHTQLPPALDYFSAGAKGYLIKGPLSPELEGEPQNVTQAWRDASRLIERLVKEYQPIKQLLYDDRISGTLKKEKGERTLPIKFLNQYNFLKLIKNMRGSIADLFPVETLELLTSESYRIPFYRSKSLREAILDLREREEIVATAKAVLGPLVSQLKTELFDRNLQTKMSRRDEWFEKTYTTKLKTRIADTFELLKGYSTSDQAALTALMTTDRIIVGGQPFLSPEKILDLLKSDEKLLNQTTPEDIGYIHGDLHFANILVDATIIEKPFVKLIDPAGFLEGADFAYDAGKLLLSSEALHDMIDNEYFGDASLIRSVVKKDSSVFVDPPKPRYERERTLKSGRSGDTVKSRRQEISDSHFLAYKEIADWIKSDLLPLVSGSDPHLVTRARLNAALLSCTVTAFHLEHNAEELESEEKEQGPVKVAAFYITGVKLINQLARDLGLDIDSHLK